MQGVVQGRGTLTRGGRHHIGEAHIMVTQAHNANGHRRREVVKRVRAEETHCALCDKHVDKTLRYETGKHGPKCHNTDCKGCVPHPMSGEVDEDVPRSRGGSPYDRRNTRLMHRKCNNWKSKMTISEARQRLHGEENKPLPKPRALGNY